MLKKLSLALVLITITTLVSLGIYYTSPNASPMIEPPRMLGYYVIRVDDTSPEGATKLVTDTIVTELSRFTELAEGYPRLGQVRFAKPGEEGDQCVPKSLEGYAICILLNERNEFVRIVFRTDPTPALHHYTVYVLSSWPWNRVDPDTTGRVEIDVAAKSDFVVEAIGNALISLGVREYSP